MIAGTRKFFIVRRTSKPSANRLMEQALDGGKMVGQQNETAGDESQGVLSIGRN